MKRIQSACLEQTIHFLAKEDMPREEAAALMRAEYDHYLQQLDRSRTAYKVLEERTLPDGAIEIRLKRQYNSYQVGNYLD